MIIGIDPGKSGGVAMLTQDGEFISGLRMPLLQHGKRDLVSPFDLNTWLTGERPTGVEGAISRVVIEQVSAMPNQGVVSMFNFGRHTGAVECWALGLSSAVRWVTPSVWKKAFGFAKGSGKRASLDRARLEFGENKLWSVKANDGIAEAALIALWSLRHG